MLGAGPGSNNDGRPTCRRFSVLAGCWAQTFARRAMHPLNIFKFTKTRTHTHMAHDHTAKQQCVNIYNIQYLQIYAVQNSTNVCPNIRGMVSSYNMCIYTTVGFQFLRGDVFPRQSTPVLVHHLNVFLRTPLTLTFDSAS